MDAYKATLENLEIPQGSHLDVTSFSEYSSFYSSNQSAASPPLLLFHLLKIYDELPLSSIIPC